MTDAREVLGQLNEVEKALGKKTVKELEYNSIEGLPPFGTYVQIGKEIGELLEKKQISYGNSFGRISDIMNVLYPNGIGPEQYMETLTVVRIIDKLFRIATNKDQFSEDPFSDIAGYAILMLGNQRKEGESK